MTAKEALEQAMASRSGIKTTGLKKTDIQKAALEIIGIKVVEQDGYIFLINIKKNA